MSALNVILTRQAVYAGDHAQDMTAAIDVDPGMTVGEMAEKYLRRESGEWNPEPPHTRAQVPDQDRYLTIRLAVAEVSA